MGRWWLRAWSCLQMREGVGLSLCNTPWLQAWCHSVARRCKQWEDLWLDAAATVALPPPIQDGGAAPGNFPLHPACPSLWKFV